MDIKKVAVLGSGVMGSGIAAHVANSGTPVILLDIVPEGATNRNVLSESAVDKMLVASPSPFIHKNTAKLITCGNLEDDLDLLSDVDWIVEAVLERLDVKQSVYKKIDAVRKADSVVSSNTSTIPLGTLLEGLPASFAQDFMITHFFNPPRYMRLLEVTGSKDTRKEAYEKVKTFCDVRLGKGVVTAKDTPGFLANRIGVYWMMSGVKHALEMGISVEEADAVMGRPVGIPKTGLFGLFDLIGIDLMPLIAKSMLATLPEKDAFRGLYKEPELVKKMIADGYTGRKGKGGFYRINKDGGNKVKEVINLKTGEYAPEKKATLESIEAAKTGINALLTHPDIGGRFAYAVMLDTLHYAASLIPEISDDILAVDEAMKLGFNWKYGPFEMIDRLGVKDISGTRWLSHQFKGQGRFVPALLEKAEGKPLYRLENGKRQYLTLAGEYKDIPTQPGVLLLSDMKLTKKPVLKNASASLWDMGDGVACFELTSKMNSIDPDILALFTQSIEAVKKDFKGMVIGGDAENFSVGANLAFILMAANMAAWPMISDVIRQGQNTMMALKYAPFPVVPALAGMALGGGCEIVLHGDGVQAHVESYPGLVEVGVGVIPGWGGCKELLIRTTYAAEAIKRAAQAQGGLQKSFALVSTDEKLKQAGTNGSATSEKLVASMPIISKVFETIGMARVATSAAEAKDMLILNEKSDITMNRARVLADAKAKCLMLAKNYKTPQQYTLSLPGASARSALMMAVENLKNSGKATPHDVVVSEALAHVLTGGDTDITESLTEQKLLDLEHEAFMQLIKTKGTLARIQHMLETNKPLRN